MKIPKGLKRYCYGFQLKYISPIMQFQTHNAYKCRKHIETEKCLICRQRKSPIRHLWRLYDNSIRHRYIAPMWNYKADLFLFNIAHTIIIKHYTHVYSLYDSIFTAWWIHVHTIHINQSRINIHAQTYTHTIFIYIYIYIYIENIYILHMYICCTIPYSTAWWIHVHTIHINQSCIHIHAQTYTHTIYIYIYTTQKKFGNLRCLGPYLM